jgi:hypothetical protein
MSKADISLIATIRDVAPYADGYATFGITESPETSSGYAVTIGVRQKDGNMAAVDVDIEALMDVCVLLGDAIEASKD